MIVNIYLTHDYKSFEENHGLKIDDDLLIPIMNFYGETSEYIKVRDDYDILYLVEKKYIDMVKNNE